MQFDFDIKHISGVKNVVADLLSRFVKNHMKTQIVEDTATELIDLPSNVVQKAVDEVVLILLFLYEVIPDKIYLKIKKVHNSVVRHGAHQGQAWKVFMRTHVKFFIKQCTCCQKMSNLKISIQAHDFVTTFYTPMSLLIIDFIGPLNTEEDTVYFRTIICYSTRWIDLYVVDNITPKKTAQALLQHFGRFGAPNRLRLNQVSRFINEVLKGFLCLKARTMK